LVIYAEDNGIVRAMRNIPGVETACVDRLNPLELCPGGHLGRFCIWTESAIKKIQAMYGNQKGICPGKANYFLPRPMMENADLARIINSTEIQSVLRPKLEKPKSFGKKKNPIANKKVMAKLNPGVLQKMAARKRAAQEGTDEYKLVQKRKKARVDASKAHNKKAKKGDHTFYKTLMKAFETKPKEEKEEESEGE